jgi:SAM-dependent methyltransferase
VSHDPQTLAFYAKEAEAYAAQARMASAPELTAFLARLPPGGHIFDLGCGGGQDALAMIRAGFSVTAQDGCPDLAREAERLIRQAVRIQLFEDLDDAGAFDAVWANASLHHVPKRALSQTFARIHRALKPGGLLYASFKTGRAEGRDALGRYYNNPAKEELAAVLGPPAWDAHAFKEGTGPGYDGVVTGWISFTVLKAAPLANPHFTG